MLQAVYFDKHLWTAQEALIWLHHNQLYPIKAPRLTLNEIRFRIRPPIKGARYRTFRLPSNVYMVDMY